MSVFKSSPPDVNEAMKYATDDKVSKHSKLGGITTPQKVTWIQSEYDQREALQLYKRVNELENHEIYTSLNKGQWPKSIVSELETSNRIKDLTQFNFVIKKVDGIVGHLVRNGYDAEFVSVEGDDNGILQVMRDLYYTDKEGCDWDTEFNTFFKNGVIKTGWMMMTPDYRIDPQFGNIGLQTLLPGTVFPDPNWVTNNSGDMKNCFTVSYLTGNDIKNKYKTKSERLDILIRQNLMAQISEEDITTDATPRFDLEDEYNKAYQVIEYHHMETEERKTGVGLTDFYQSVRVPDKASDEWYELNKVDKNSVMWSTENVEIYYVTTIIPQIDTVEPFEDRAGFYQLGRLPLFHWSFNRHNGIDIGAVDLLRDPQQYYNQMLSLTHESIAHSRRAKVIDWGMFDEDQGSQEELKQKFTDPNEVIWTKPDATNEYPNGIQEAGQSQPAYNEQNFANNILGSTDRIVPFTSGMEGISEGQRQSGIKFELGREQGEVTMSLLKDSVKNFFNELSEGWFYASRAQYGGMYREFHTKNGTVEINKPLPDGRIWNDLSALPRTKVVVTESPEGISRRVGDRIIAFEAMQRLGGQMPLIDLEFASIIFDSMDNISEERKKKFKEVAEEQRIMLKSGNMAITSQNEMAIAQSQQQVNQMMQPQPSPEEMAMQQQAQGGGGGEQMPPEQPMPEQPPTQ